MATVGELYERYRPVIWAKVSGGTIRAYKSAWNRRVGPSFANRDIRELTTLDVEVEFATWSGALSTRKDALALLSAICRVAVKGGMIASNPCVGVELPRTQKADVAARSLNLDELERLLAVLPRSGPYTRFVLAMLFTGCRLGEIAALRISDVDWSNRTINVVRTASAGASGELVIGPTKGRRGRAVPMAAPLAPLVAEASRDRGPFDLLFPGPRDGYINSKNLSRALGWHDVREQVKQFPPDEEKLHWHDLRHTAAVMLFRAGVSLPDAQAILGHSSIAVTQMYANTRNDAAKRGAVALSDFYALQSNSQLEGGDHPQKSGRDLGF